MQKSCLHHTLPYLYLFFLLGASSVNVQAQVPQGTCGLGWPVSRLKSTTTSNSITVSWQNAELYNNDAQAAYTVKYKLSSSGSWSSLNVGAETTATISDLQAEKRYYVKVERSCNGVTRDSNTKTIKTGDSNGESSTGRPPTLLGSCRFPTEESHDNITATSISLHYKKFNSGISNNQQEFSQFQIAEGPASSILTGDGRLIADASGADHIVQGLKPDTIYHWWVEKHCSQIDSYGITVGGSIAKPFSAHEFKTSAVVENCPLTTGLKLDELKSDWGEIDWEPTEGASSYTVALSENDAPWVFIEVTEKDHLDDLDTHLKGSLKPRTKYDIGVKTNCHGGTQSDWNWSERLIFNTPE